MRKYPTNTGSDTKGRIALVVIFLVFRLVDILTFLSVPEEGREHILGNIFISFLWTTVCLVAIWMRKNWARYVLSVLLGLSVFFLFMIIPDMLSHGRTLPLILPISGAVNLIVIVVLIYLPSLRTLTERWNPTR